MKVLLDQHMPHRLRHELVGHDVVTARYAGLSEFENGELLARAGAMNFDVLITTDKGMEYEQNLLMLPISIVILRVRSNAIQSIRPLIPRLLATLDTLTPRTLVRIDGR